MRPVLMFRGSRYYFSPFTEFLYSLQTGIPAREKVLGKGAFEYLRADPEAERVFDEAMTAISALWASAIAAHLRVRTLGNGDRRRRRQRRTPGRHPARPSFAPWQYWPTHRPSSSARDVASSSREISRPERVSRPVISFRPFLQDLAPL